MAEIEELSLATMLGGAVIERVNDELARVLLNTVDPNTNPTAKRKVKLELVFKPEKDRSMGSVEVSVTSALAPAEKISTRLFIALTKAGPVATEFNPNQPKLPGVDAATVTPLRVAGGTNA